MKSLRDYLPEGFEEDPRRNPIDSHYSQPSDESEAIAELSKLPQPITINGGGYGYSVDVTKQPLVFTASDGAVVDRAKTLRDIADWMDEPTPWINFLDGEEDLRYLIQDGLVRPNKSRDTPWSDQEEHEMRNYYGESINDLRRLSGLNEAEEEPHDSSSPISGAEADSKPDPAETRDGNRELNIGDPVVIKGKVNFSGCTGDVVDFGQEKRFIVVNLYNHGKHSFQASDVAFNDYAGSEEEELDNMRRLAGYR
jgi:hypothetical protein